MRTSNPALTEKTFSSAHALGEKMTIQGTVNKSLILIGTVLLSALYSWQSSYPQGWSNSSYPSIPGWYMPVCLVGFVLGIVIIFKKTWAPFLVPVYALLQGLTLGALSAVFEMRFPGIVMQAVLCTMGVFLSLLFLYKTRLVRATENFKLGVVSATLGIAFVYIIDLVLGFFGIHMPMIHEGGWLGIGFSLFVTAIAALNLVLDFDFIEKGAEQGAAKYMEWYAAFGLLVTLIWLYLEILRLLSKAKKK